MSSSRDAFWALFNYISGGNTAQQKVAMTAPVEVRSEEIAMTAPVERAVDEEGRVRMRFFLPSAYTVDTAPRPADPRVKLVPVPEETLAILRYSGIRTDENFREKSQLLLSHLQGTPWRSISMPVFFGYDPPVTIPFLRRNEVVVPVVKK
jgi:hypothetical protein